MSKVLEDRSRRTAAGSKGNAVSESVANDKSTRIAFYVFMAAVGASVITLLLMPLFIG